MSTLSGVSSKGEKGKSKFQSLDINSLYQTSKGESSEQQQTKSTVPRKHGMQILGKVPSTRRAPVNLPSLKSEHSGSDPTVSLVPTGGTGWGSKSSDAAPPPITTPTPATTSGQTQVTNAPAVVGTSPVQQTNITPTPPQPPKPVVNVGGDKTWSSVMVGGESGGSGPNIGSGSGPSFLAHQSPQFQAEFPSLPGEGGAPGPPPRAGEGGYGPGPSLRPQTEGSWAHGGGYQAPPPPQENQPRPLSTQFPPPPVSTSNMIPQFKGVVPPFMLNMRGGGAPPGGGGGGGGGGGSGGGSGGNSGFPGIFPSNFQNSIRPPKFQSTPESRFLGGGRPAQLPDSDDLMSRPIIREEDLNRMDEISRDSGWATQDDIDYNQKLAFSDEETNGNDDEKEFKGKMTHINQMREEKKDHETEKENLRDKISMNEKLSEKSSQQPWQGRNQGAIPTGDLRNSMPRLPHSNATRDMDIEDVWKEKRRQQSEQVAAVAEKAKQRKEEEEKRFEETRSKSENEKKKKEDVDSEEKKDPVETFRQMTQLETRNFSRGESQQPSFRYSSTLPPRFQKQQIRQQQQQNSSETRWSNQHFGGGKGRLRDNEDSKEKDDDKEKRDRNTPEPLDRRDKERDGEIEWEGRRGGSSSAWEGSRNIEDNKTSGRRDNKKTSDNYKSHSSVFDDRDSEWRERPDTRDRPGRPDSRDNRASRDSRTAREETRALQDSVSNDYSWADTEYEKEIQEEKVIRKESYKDERRETQTQARREGRVPGPITREKMEAYEHKHSMQAEKKELMSTSVENRLEEDSWKKIDSTTTNAYWADSSEDRTSPPQQDPKQSPSSISQMQTTLMSQLSSNQQSHQKLSQAPTKAIDSTMSPAICADDCNKDEKKDDGGIDKKKDADGSGTLGVSSPTLTTLKEKDRNNSGSGRGGRSNRGGGRQNNYSGNFNSMYFRGSSAWPSNKDTSRRGPSKSGKGWNASESEGSGDEVSASTESGKEDKKTERKQTPRSPKTGDRKRDKEDRNRDSKKNESSDKSGPGGNMIRNKPAQQQSSLSQLQPQGQSQQQVGSNQGSHQGLYQGQQTMQNQQQQSGYDSSGGGSRKEGFPPRGEPSRRGRGGFSSRVPGGRGPVGAHYGPPGSKPAFPTSLTASNDQEANDSSSEEKKRAVITGRKDQRKSDSESSRSKGKVGKLKREQEDWETTSEGSDSEAKGKQLRQNKKSGQRMGGEKRNMFNTGQMNGRPRSEDGKEKTRLNKEEEDGSRFANHSDIFHSNNGFQEVRSKKTGKDSRPLGKDDIKRARGKEKAKGLQGGNSKGPQGKSYPREWNNKPPRMQRMAYMQQQQQNQQQDTTVSDMNKINQNLSMFPIRDVSCPAPAPPPTVNAWEKPITAALRTTPPPSTTNLHHLVPTIPNSQEKNVIELNDHVPSGTSSQTSSPSAEKALSKLGREAVEKSFLDGSTPPVQTIVFENTNLKTPSEIGLKSTKYPLKGPRIDKGRDRKLDEELDDGTPHIGLGGFKPGNDMKPGENKSQEPIQMPISFSKSEDNADMKLDFPFDSDLTHLTDDKSNIPRSIHQVLGQNSAADLNQKIASVKKVWETPGSMIEHQHHDEVVSTSSSFTPNFASAVDTSLDHSSAHQVDDNTFTSDVYTSQNPTSNRGSYFIIASPQIQGSAGYTSGGANIIKQDPAIPTSNVCKVKPQPQQTVISSTIGTHSGPSLSSPPPPFTQQGHFSYQGQYNTMPAIPSPPAAAVLLNSAAAAASAQQVPPSHQGELFHSFPIGGPTVIGSQQGRSGFSQYAYNLGGGLGSTSAFSQQNLYHLPQPPAPPNPPDVFPSIGQYRLQASAAYGQSQQLSNSPSTVLITSSSNSLMSASVKSSPQPPPLGAIGSKAGYQSSAHPSQVQLGFIQYDATQMLPQNFLQNSPLVQRHGGNNVVPTIQPPTSFYSGSAGGQTGLFQPGSSILAGGGSQPAALHSATAFGMQGFGAQSATAPAQPASSNPVGVQSYSSQMGHFRGQTPTGTYLKAGSNPVPGQHSSDPSKSPSTSQDVLNSVFSSGGGGQIPSPKSRSAANSGSSGKQPQPPQQPSPTQAPPHHKFASYQPQSNMVMQSGNHNQQPGGNAGGNRGPPMPQGVRTGANNGNGLSNNGVARYPTPIQRPQVVGVGYQTMQQQRHRVSQQPRPQHQQHMKISNPYYQPQGNNVKLEVEGKDGDKLQEATNPTNKVEKKEEQTSSSDQ